MPNRADNLRFAFRIMNRHKPLTRNIIIVFRQDNACEIFLDKKSVAMSGIFCEGIDVVEKDIGDIVLDAHENYYVDYMLAGRLDRLKEIILARRL